MSALDEYGNSAPNWMQIDWRDHLHRVELGGSSVNYVDFGQGPPILFIHGLGGRWQNWLENLPHFAGGHRVVALDLPGFGQSSMPEWEISIANYGRFVTDFADRLGLGPDTVLVGNSMGGFIATEMVIDSPERFSKLVLVSAAGITFARSRQEPAAMLGRMSRLAGPTMLRFGDDAVRRPRLRRMAFSGVVYRPNRLQPELLWELAQGGLAPEAFGAAIVALTGYDVRERLTEIELPTLIVWGYNDRVVPVRAAFSYRRRIPNSQLEIFDHTGHVPMLERPARFNAVVENFLGQS